MEEKLSTNLDKVLKSRNITLPTKVHLVKASFSSSHVWMYGRKWQSTPVLLPGKSHGQRSLVGYSLWGHKESDTTEWLHSLSLMYESELDHKEGRAPKNWCCWAVVLKTLESLFDFKEIKPVNPKGNQSWIFTSKTAETEAPILWPPDAKSQFIRKDPGAGKDWRQKEKGMTEDEMLDKSSECEKNGRKINVFLYWQDEIQWRRG